MTRASLPVLLLLATACTSTPERRPDPDRVRTGSITTLSGAAAGLTGLALTAAADDQDVRTAGALVALTGAAAMMTGAFVIGTAPDQPEQPGVQITPLGLTGRF
ncbi:MAG: hypothetical protein R3F60_17210 [bacterium]